MIEQLKGHDSRHLSEIRHVVHSSLCICPQLLERAMTTLPRTEMKMGVPQSSILGDLIFICYINDLSKNCKSTVSFMYADDMALLTKGKNIELIQQNLQSEFEQLLKWFVANHSCINTGKTKLMLFSSNRSHLKDATLSITDGNECLEQVNTFKYLGIHLDRHLTFENHIDKVVNGMPMVCVGHTMILN